MWLAVIIGVCLAVEVLSYISGDEFRLRKEEKIEEQAFIPSQTSLHLHPILKDLYIRFRSAPQSAIAL